VSLSKASALPSLPSSQRQLGAYYTPGSLAQYLISWALRDRLGSILDPSYGGCAFVNAALEVLTERGVQVPGAYIFGVDVDPSCVQHVAQQPGLKQAHFVTQDFLTVLPGDLIGAPFAAIVGNPPYVRHHWLKGEARKAARHVTERAGVRLPATSSVWAYFVLHAMQFLASDGRIAMLVPEAILQTNYGQAVRAALTARFGKIYLIRVCERLFTGTDEAVIVLAASEKGPGIIRFGEVKQASEVEHVLSDPDRAMPTAEKTREYQRFSHPRCHNLLDELMQHPKVVRMGKLATVRIGVVTGANDFFLFSSHHLEEKSIPASAVLPIVARTRWLTGLQYGADDHNTVLQNEGTALLCSPSADLTHESPIQAWIADGERRELHLRYKCRVRTPWYSVPVGMRPDAFATCSRFGSPLLVLNQARVWCTNALHAVWWKGHVDPTTVAVSFLTTLTAAYAEMYGRRYGGGVLKVEPGLLIHLPIPLIPLAPGTFEEIDCLLREGREREGRILADRVILQEGLDLTAGDILRLRSMITELAASRMPLRGAEVDYAR